MRCDLALQYAHFQFALLILLVQLIDSLRVEGEVQPAHPVYLVQREPSVENQVAFGLQDIRENLLVVLRKA